MEIDLSNSGRQVQCRWIDAWAVWPKGAEYPVIVLRIGRVLTVRLPRYVAAWVAQKLDRAVDEAYELRRQGPRD